MTKTSRSLRMLNLANGHVHYGKLHILQGVSMRVNEGEAVALLGRNGVGKTTTLRAIMGLVPRSAGKVSFGGTDFDTIAPHLVPRMGVGYVPQGRGDFSDLHGYENLRPGP